TTPSGPTPFPYTTLFRSGVLSAFSALRAAGELPRGMQAKISVMLPAANPATARVLVDLGADTINLPTDLTLAQIAAIRAAVDVRSEEHTSELQSQSNLVC